MTVCGGGNPSTGQAEAVGSLKLASTLLAELVSSMSKESAFQKLRLRTIEKDHGGIGPEPQTRTMSVSVAL